MNGRGPAVAGRSRAVCAAVALFVFVILVARPHAQAQAPAFGTRPVSAPVMSAETGPIDLLVGRSTVLNMRQPIARVSLTVPDIADAMVTAPHQLLIHGKAPGTISLFVWDRAGGIRTYEVVVRRDLTELREQLVQLFPGEPITATSNGTDVVLAGSVSGQYVIDKAAEVAVGYVEKKENVVNLLRQQEGIASNQVLLRVRFAEVSRSAIQELGASFFSDRREDYIGRTTTQQFAAPFFNQSGANVGDHLVFSDYLNLFLFDYKNHLGAVIKAMQSRGLFQSLAEPNLIAANGTEASFLAGGEFPFPVIQGSVGGQSVTIQFKEFGVRLRFTPTVLGGDLIHLKVRPEVSALDFNNAVIVEGFRIPALTTRRTETELELRDGQTFAIAGLMNNTVTETMRKVPGIGDIPILGTLFRSKAHQKDQTELVVMITPQILRRDSTGVAPGLPDIVEPFLAPPKKALPPPPPHVPQAGGRTAGPEPAARPAGPAAAPVVVGDPQLALPFDSSALVARPVAAPAQQPEAPQAPAARSTPSTQGVAPVQTVQPAVQEPAPAPAPRTLTRQEQQRLERARQVEARMREQEEREARIEAERAAKAAEQQRLAEERRAAEEARIEARRAAEQAKRDEKAAREQAKREQREAREQARQEQREARARQKAEREQAKRDAKAAREQAKLEARAAKALEAAEKRRARLASRHGASLDQAAERLKEAQAMYQAEIERLIEETSRYAKDPASPSQ